MSTPKFELTRAAADAGYSASQQLREQLAAWQARYDRAPARFKDSDAGNEAAARIETLSELIDSLDEFLPVKTW